MIDIDGPTATIIAALLVVLIAVVGFVGTVHYRLGKQEKNDELLAQEIRHSREVSDAQHAETMLEIRRPMTPSVPIATKPTVKRYSVYRY